LDERERRDHTFHLTRRDALLGAGAAIVAGGLAACGSSGSSSSSTPAASGGSSGAASGPKKGGNLKLGVGGNGSKDIIDGQSIVVKSDQARLMAGWETLLVYDRDYKLTTDGLAESVEPDGATAYIIKLKQGIEFHNGKTMTADDVVYSLQRLTNASLGLFGSGPLKNIDPKNITKQDQYTVRVGTLIPDSTIPDGLAAYAAGIVPQGYNSQGGKASSMAQGQIGTGPFVLQSFTPGSQSVHTKFANYWRTGLPYVDQVTIINIDDSTARINGLISGQVDVIADVPFSSTGLVTAKPNLVLFDNEGGGWLPLTMRVDVKPFNDPNVRKAFRLMVDRQQMVESVLSGHGAIGNDMFARFDPNYPSTLPQRAQDLEQAKSLLKTAGYENMSIDLNTTDWATGMNDMCKVFAEQAKGAGVTVNVKVLDSATFTGKTGDPNSYLNWTFADDFWGTRLYLNQAALSSIPGAIYNETHWPPKSGNGSNYLDLYKQGLAETDPTKRGAIVSQMFQIDYDDGPYIIPFFNNLIDAYSNKVTGFQKNRGTLNLDSFGRNYTEVSFV
jgi:peptide/nickel transport system substrate-binding protein